MNRLKKTRKVFITVMLSSLLLPIACVASGNETERELVQIAHLKNYFQLFHPLKTNRIWPGYSPNESPTFLYYNTGRYYALNFSPRTTDWKAIETPAGYVYYTNKDKWGIHKKSVSTHLTIDGQNGFAYQVDQLKDDLSLHVFVHERFHRYQQEQFAQPNNHDWYFDARNVDNLVYIELENRILTHYLQHNDTQDLKDFLQINHYRSRLIKPSSRQREAFLRRIEGTATYVELLSKSYFESNSSSLLPQFILQEHNRRRLSQGTNQIVDQAVQWRHYFIGAALCHALDSLGIEHWQAQIAQGTDPIVILRRRLMKLSSYSKKARRDVQQKYHFSHLRRAVTANFQQYQKQLAKWHQLLSDQPGVYVELQKPQHTLRVSHHSTRRYYMADQSVLLINTEGQQKDTLDSWTLRYHSLPLLLDSPSSWVTKLTLDAVYTINGKRVHSVALGKRQSWKFNTLSIRDKNLTFQTRVPGVLFVDSNHLKIKSGSWHR